MIAVLLGPWAACIAVSVALLFGSLLFARSLRLRRDERVVERGVFRVQVQAGLPAFEQGLQRTVDWFREHRAQHPEDDHDAFVPDMVSLNDELRREPSPAAEDA